MKNQILFLVSAVVTITIFSFAGYHLGFNSGYLRGHDVGYRNAYADYPQATFNGLTVNLTSQHGIITFDSLSVRADESLIDFIDALPGFDRFFSIPDKINLKCDSLYFEKDSAND